MECISNYGSPIIGGENKPHAGCGRSSKSDRSSYQPYVVCNNNGNGTASWSPVSNDCSACRNCNTADKPPTNPPPSWSKQHSCDVKTGVGGCFLGICLPDKWTTYYCSTYLGCSADCAGVLDHNSSKDCTRLDTSCNAGGGTWDLASCKFYSSAICTVECTDGVYNFKTSWSSGF